MDGFGGVRRHISDCRVDLRRRERACGWRASTRVQSRFPRNIVANGIVFGLYLAFTAAQDWGDIDRANAAVNREASALSAIVILAASFPGEPEQQTRALVRRYIENTAFQEWPMMARHSTQRINISMSQVNWVKWSCLFVQAICLFLAIAMMHNDNRSNSALALGLFATGGAAAVLLIATHNRPFTGEISVGPGPLLQVLPEEKTS